GGHPLQTLRALALARAKFPPAQLALHPHDPRGTALANCRVGMEMGIATYDTSIGGTGGCPYATGAAGNLATEDLVSMCADMGIETGIDLGKLLDAGALAQELIAHNLTRARLQPAAVPRAPVDA